MKRLLLFLSCVLLTPTAIWAMDADDEQQTEFEHFEELPKEIQQKIFLQEILSQDTVDGVIDTVKSLRTTNKNFYNLVISGGRFFVDPISEHLCDVFIAEFKEIILEKITQHEGPLSSEELITIFNEYNIQKVEFLNKLILTSEALQTPLALTDDLYSTTMESVLHGDIDPLKNLLNNFPFMAQFFYFDLTLDLFKKNIEENYTITFDRSVIELLQTYGVNIFKPLLNDFSLLMIVVMHGLVDVVNYLIEQGMDVNQENLQNWSALNYAVNRGLIEIISILLVVGADINHQDTDGMTPLHWALAAGNLEVATMLVEFEANIHIVNSFGMTPLLFACREVGIGIDFIHRLLQNNANVNAVSVNLISSLMFTAINNRDDVVSLLLQNGAEIDLRSDRGHTALKYAVGNNNLPIVELLLNAEAESNIQDNNGWIPLHVAIGQDNPEIVQLLLGVNADPNLQNNDGWTSLHVATEQNNFDLVQLLLEFNADSNIQNNDGWTSLMYAADHKNVEMVDFLLRRGQGESTKYSLMKAHLYIKWINYLKPILKLTGVGLTLVAANYILYKIITEHDGRIISLTRKLFQQFSK